MSLLLLWIYLSFFHAVILPWIPSHIWTVLFRCPLGGEQIKLKHSQEGRLPCSEMAKIDHLASDYISQFQCVVFFPSLPAGGPVHCTGCSRWNIVQILHRGLQRESGLWTSKVDMKDACMGYPHTTACSLVIVLSSLVWAVVLKMTSSVPFLKQDTGIRLWFSKLNFLLITHYANKNQYLLT